MMIFRVILFVGLAVVCVVCVPAVNMSVRLQQNVSLPCDSHSNSSTVLAWFRLGPGENMALLLSASRGVLKRDEFIVEHNMERSQFELQAHGRLESVSLRIFSVRDEDLGLYFCSTGTSLKNMHFGTAVRLTLTDASSDVGCPALWISVCVCVFAACVCCGFFCTCVLCFRKDCSVVLCISCVKENSHLQAVPVQYSSLRFIQRSRTPAPAPVDVTYATIAKHTP
ncbi:uncharacterized protein LOC120464691 [Pimephales promelas]|uniref:uncharacterized protein LOC120464691 n=1 Tax=Pimephales promelas TaxID=90988 RepID=UPI0019555045|nr:uncharacterized protein LOC120464691 [Pimephales promelas]